LAHTLRVLTVTLVFGNCIQETSFLKKIVFLPMRYTLFFLLSVTENLTPCAIKLQELDTGLELKMPLT